MIHRKSTCLILVTSVPFAPYALSTAQDSFFEPLDVLNDINEDVVDVRIEVDVYAEPNAEGDIIADASVTFDITTDEDTPTDFNRPPQEAETESEVEVEVSARRRGAAGVVALGAGAGAVGAGAVAGVLTSGSLTLAVLRPDGRAVETTPAEGSFERTEGPLAFPARYAGGGGSVRSGASSGVR